MGCTFAKGKVNNSIKGFHNNKIKWFFGVVGQKSYFKRNGSEFIILREDFCNGYV